MSLSSGLSSYRPSSYVSGDSRYSTGSYSYYNNDPTSSAWRQSSSYLMSSSNRPLRVSTSETTSLNRQSSTEYPYGRSYTTNYGTTYGDSYGSYRDRTASRSQSQDRSTILNSFSSGGSLRLSTQTRSPAGNHVRWAMDRISSSASDRRTASPIRAGRSSYLDDLHSYYRRPGDSISSTASSIDDLDDRWALRQSATVGSIPESALKTATLSRSYATNSLSSYSANKETEAEPTPKPSPRPLSGKSRVVWADEVKEDLETATASTSRAVSGVESGSRGGSGGAEVKERRSILQVRHDHRQAPSSSSGNNEEDRHGLVGLENLGNTCFMNSVLQCLSNTKELQSYCLNGAVTSDVNNNQTSKMKGALMKGFCELLSELWDRQHGHTAVNPGRFRDQVKKFAPRFGSYNQQDSQEFLRYLLQGLHEDINQVPRGPRMAFKEIDEQLPDAEKSAEAWRRYLHTEKSKIVDIFVGQFKSELRCTVCDHVSTTDLSLSIPAKSRSVSLYNCFDMFVQEEVLDGDEMPTCEKCKKRRKCTKRFSIQRFPQVLVLHLKRFSGDHFRARLSTLVEFPLEGLDLRPYAAKNTDTAPIYDLHAVSNHSGTPSFGHYTAYCKHVTSGQWFYFDDRNVRPVSANAVVSELAYVLFYELSPSSSAAAKL